MKKLAMAICGVAVAACGAADAKTLVAYYSRSGNTAAVAKMIQTATGGDIFEIKTADADYYPAEYTPMTEVAKKEIADETLPPINDVPDLTQYDTVLIGTPIWWGTMSSPVRTFLTQNSLSGKTVAPFVSHGGGGAGTSFADIEKLTSGAASKQGYAVYGDDATSDGIDAWLTEIGVK